MKRTGKILDQKPMKKNINSSSSAWRCSVPKKRLRDCPLFLEVAIQLLRVMQYVLSHAKRCENNWCRVVPSHKHRCGRRCAVMMMYFRPPGRSVALTPLVRGNMASACAYLQPTSFEPRVLDKESLFIGTGFPQGAAITRCGIYCRYAATR